MTMREAFEAWPNERTIYADLIRATFFLKPDGTVTKPDMRRAWRKRRKLLTASTTQETAPLLFVER